MKQGKKIFVAGAVLLAVSILVLTGCGEKEEESPRTEVAEAQLDVSQVEAVADDGGEQDEAQEGDAGADQDADTAKVQSDEQDQGAETDIVIHRTQGEWDEINLKERAEFEERVEAAGGITEEEAIEIARKTMEEDIGEKAKGLKLAEPGEYGWKAYLWDITDWEEYNAKGGELGWSIQFNNVEDVENYDDLFSYECMVDAMNGSICGACTHQGFIDGETVWYEH